MQYNRVTELDRTLNTAYSTRISMEREAEPERSYVLKEKHTESSR